MKYFVKRTRNLVPMDPKTGISLFQAAKQWINAQLANGSMDLNYVHVETGAGCAITNAASHEEMYTRILEYPLYPFFDWEVVALVDWSHSYDGQVELLQKIAAMK